MLSMFYLKTLKIVGSVMNFSMVILQLNSGCLLFLEESMFAFYLLYVINGK